MGNRVNGRAKGSKYERTLAAKIVGAFAGATKDDCYRSPGSGGHLRFSKRDAGDLVFTPRLQAHFPFSLEAKCYKGFHLGMVCPMGQQVEGWLAQSIRDAHKTKKYPLLVCHVNNSLREIAVLPASVLGSRRASLPWRLHFFKWKREWVATDFDALLELYADGVVLK